jgi:hypothetical protein
MTSRDFVIWLKGFSKASNSYNITPKQWDDIQDQLNEVNDNELIWEYEPNEALIETAEKYKKLIPEESKIF